VNYIYILNFGAPVISFQSVKLGTSNLVCWLILRYTIAGMIDYLWRGCVQSHVTYLILWK